MIHCRLKEDFMTETVLECQGLPCPQPVLKCRKAVEQDAPTRLTVIVDNEPARDNVSRFLGNKGYETSSTHHDGEYTVIAERDESGCQECRVMTDEQIRSAAEPAQGRLLVFIGSEVMGGGDDELGSKLIYNFLATLKEMGDELWRIVMLNGGVKLAVEGSPCVELLRELEEGGVSLLVCGTCLEHFGLTPKKQVGETTNMLDIVTSFQLATKVIRV